MLFSLTFTTNIDKSGQNIRNMNKYAVKAQTSLGSVVMPCWFTRTNAHAHQYCIFQSYAKTVQSRMKLTMKLTMRELASMTTDTWSRHVTSDFNSVLGVWLGLHGISQVALPSVQSLLFIYTENLINFPYTEKTHFWGILRKKYNAYDSLCSFVHSWERVSHLPQNALPTTKW